MLDVTTEILSRFVVHFFKVDLSILVIGVGSLHGLLETVSVFFFFCILLLSFSFLFFLSLFPSFSSLYFLLYLLLFPILGRPRQLPLLLLFGTRQRLGGFIGFRNELLEISIVTHFY